MREFSVPPLVNVPETANVADPLYDNAEQYPRVVQFTIGLGQNRREVTCAQFRDEVVAVARGLIAAGIAKGDRVALMSRTRYEWSLLDYAILSIGAVTVPIYETSSPEQIQWILADSRAVACLVETREHRERVESVREQAPALRDIWQIDPDDTAPATATGAVAQLTAAGSSVDPDEITRRRTSISKGDLATIIYTSGTTGRPKGCMTTHHSIYWDAANAVAGLPTLFCAGARSVLFLPLAHSFARVIQMGLVLARTNLLHLPDTKNLMPAIAEHRPTFLLAVPRVFEKVYNASRQKAQAGGKVAIFDKAAATAAAYSEALDRPGGPGVGLRLRHRLFDVLVAKKVRKALGGELTAAISGGAPLGLWLAHFFRGIGVTVYEGYGLTETAPVVGVNLVESLRIGTVGQPIPGGTVRIADDGEILVRGPFVFPGYWNDPESTKQAIDEDGWFHTGDVGTLDEDGFLTVTGRKKELIITSGGKNVAPAPLENKIRSHPLVSQCLVIGDRMPFISALITIDEEAAYEWMRLNGRPKPASGSDLREDPALLDEIRKAVEEANKSVSTAESVRAFRILPVDFTEANGMLTPSLKVKRAAVMKEYADEIASIYG